MAGDLKAASSLYHIGVVRLGACGKQECPTKTRLALVIPVSDIEPGGNPGLAGVRLCGDHIAESIKSLDKVASRGE